jgi:phosphinothricin acetyltransferase
MRRYDLAMLVRTFEERDIGSACVLTNHFIQNTAIHFGATCLTEAEFAETWRAGVAKGASRAFPWLVVEAEGRLAGYAKAGTWRARDAYAFTAETTVYVDPGFHRRGLGRAVYAELLARLRAAGFHTALGGIALPNEGSIRLHETMGFRHVGVFREVGRKFDRWHDTSWWQLML